MPCPSTPRIFALFSFPIAGTVDYTGQPWALAEDVIEGIQAKQLGKEQSKALNAPKMRGPQTRVRAAGVSVKYAYRNDTLKAFSSRGQLDFSIKGPAEPAFLEFKDRIESGNDRALGVSTDLGKLESVASLFAKIVKKFGRLDVLFRADVSVVGTLFNDITFNHLQNFVNINLTGSFLCAQNGFRMLKDQQLQSPAVVNRHRGRTDGELRAHGQGCSAGQQRNPD